MSSSSSGSGGLRGDEKRGGGGDAGGRQEGVDSSPPPPSAPPVSDRTTELARQLTPDEVRAMSHRVLELGEAAGIAAAAAATTEASDDNVSPGAVDHSDGGGSGKGNRKECKNGKDEEDAVPPESGSPSSSSVDEVVKKEAAFSAEGAAGFGLEEAQQLWRRRQKQQQQQITTEKNKTTTTTTTTVGGNTTSNTNKCVTAASAMTATAQRDHNQPTSSSASPAAAAAAATEPGAVRVRGTNAPHTSVEDSGLFSVTEPFPEVPPQSAMPAVPPQPPPVLPEQPVTVARAISDEEIENEVRERILKDAVRAAKVTPIPMDSTGDVNNERLTVERSPDLEAATGEEAEGPKEEGSSSKGGRHGENVSGSGACCARNFGRGSKCHRWRWWLTALACSVAAVVVVVLGAVLGTTDAKVRDGTPHPSRGQHQPADDNGGSNNYTTATAPPTAGGTFREPQALYESLVSQSPSVEIRLSDEGSPAHRAYNFILYDESRSQMPLDDRMVDLFALLTMYYGLNGNAWAENSGWASPSNVCSWYGIQCSGDGYVTVIRLRGNNLVGDLPPEVSLLSNYLTHLDLSANGLQGRYPPVLSSQLSYLNFSHNLLQQPLFAGQLGHEGGGGGFSGRPGDRGGSLPPLPEETSETAVLTALSTFDFSSNYISGTLPESIGDFTAMEEFFVNNNRFKGSVPQSISLWTNLRSARFDTNAFTGSIPPALCQNVTEITVDCLLVNCTCCSCVDQRQ